MSVWRNELERAKLFLSRHRLRPALRSLEAALSSCPVRERRGLSTILLYIGATLYKLRCPEEALQSWEAALKLEKRGRAGRMARRFCNGYGMVKASDPVGDDRNAFFAIQEKQYLGAKKSGRYANKAEQEVVRRTIETAWEDITASGALEGLDCAKKLSIFTLNQVFDLEGTNGAPIFYDFRRHQPMNYDSSCFCGSGLPFRMCCGRVLRCEDIIDRSF